MHKFSSVSVMDASASTKPDADTTNVFNFFLNIDDIAYTTPLKLKSSVIKYTKLPDFDFDSKATWSPNSYVLKPRLRRIISLDEDELLRMCRSNPAVPPKMMATSHSHTKRKFVTISEDDENVDDLHPKCSKDKKSFSDKTSNKSMEEDFKTKPSQNRLTSRLSNSTKSTWSPNSYVLKPRLRRIISLGEDELLRTSRSLKTNPAAPPRMMATSHSHTNRKFVTISEDDENVDLNPKFSKDKKSFSDKTSSKSMEADFKTKQSQNRLTSRLSNSTKFSKEINTSAKTKSTASKKEMIVSVAQHPRRGRYTGPIDKSKIIRNEKEKETLLSSRSLKPSLKTRVLSKALVIPSESEKKLTKIKNILYDNAKSKSLNNKPVEKSARKLPQLQNKSPKVIFKDLSSKAKPLSVIHVPLDVKYKKKDRIVSAVPEEETVLYTVDCTSETDDVVHYKDAAVATEPLPTSINQITEMQDFAINTCESKPLSVIHLPLDVKYKKKDRIVSAVPEEGTVMYTVDCTSETDDVVHYKDAVVATDPLPTLISQITEMQDIAINSYESKPLSLIHAPRHVKYKMKDRIVSALPEEETVVYTVDCTSETDHVLHYKDAVVATEPLPTSISQITEMEDFAINTRESICQTDYKKTLFDSLEMPNVTLTKDKSEPNEDTSAFKTTSLPNLKVASLKIVPQSEEVNSSDISIFQQHKRREHDVSATVGS